MVWFGHRFWYENSGEQAFTEQQLAELKKVKCCKEIRRTQEEVIFPLSRWVWPGCCATMQKTSARFSLLPSRYIHMTIVVQKYLLNNSSSDTRCSQPACGLWQRRHSKPQLDTVGIELWPENQFGGIPKGRRQMLFQQHKNLWGHLTKHFLTF